jgi:transcriptional regulator with XRE-family HTH domain
MAGDRLLGEFLRARRRITTPAQAGLPPMGGRRTPGLRREEVAMLAGVSAGYYTRLEQGTERHPSDQVLNALARALQLDAGAAGHLYELAHPCPYARGSAAEADQVDASVTRLVERLRVPAFVVNRRLDVLVRNSLSAGLCGWMEHSENLLRMAVLNPVAREFFRDWEQDAALMVALTRGLAGAAPSSSLPGLVEELSAMSADFRRLWARHDVKAPAINEVKRLHHRDLGDMTFRAETFGIGGGLGQLLVIMQTRPDSHTERTLPLLDTGRPPLAAAVTTPSPPG